MKAMYKKRLLTLAKHLDKGKLAHLIFDFSYFNTVFGRNGRPKSLPDNRCGSAGCALGECPAIFKDWKWGDNEVSYKFHENEFAAMEFFGLNEDDTDYLFFPNVNEDSLPSSATRFDVANRIREFVRDN